MDSHSSSTASLYHLARLNCRERLLVDPLRWTGRHLELLQCSFKDPSPASPTMAHQSGHRGGRASHHIQRLISGRAATRNDAMQNILASPGSLLLAKSVQHDLIVLVSCDCY